MAKSAETGKSNWATNLTKKVPVIIDHATDKAASKAYKTEVADFLDLKESDISDEDKDRVSGLEELTKEEMKKRIEGKEDRWYGNMQDAFAA